MHIFVGTQYSVLSGTFKEGEPLQNEILGGSGSDGPNFEPPFKGIFIDCYTKFTFGVKQFPHIKALLIDSVCSL